MHNDYSCKTAFLCAGTTHRDHISATASTKNTPTKILTLVIRGLKNVKSFFTLKWFFAYSCKSNEYARFYNQKKTTKRLLISETNKKAARVFQRFFFNVWLFIIKKKSTADMISTIISSKWVWLFKPEEHSRPKQYRKVVSLPGRNCTKNRK